MTKFTQHSDRSARPCRAARLLMACLAFSTFACSGDRELGDYPPSACDLAEPPAEFSDVPLVISTFWRDKEAAAYEVLKSHIDPAYVPTKQEMRTRASAQRRLIESLKEPIAPDVFQVNGGSDVLRLVENRDSESTDVCALDKLRDANRWSEDYFESSLAPLSCSGSLFGLPVGIHRLNVLFYNRKVFEQLAEKARAQRIELRAPAELQSAADLVEELGRIQRLDPAVIPLAIGSKEQWPIIAFENVLLSLGGAAYETLWKDGLKEAGGEPRDRLRGALQEMLATLDALNTLSTSAPELTWQQALTQVGSGEALMTITGDWGWEQIDEEARGDVETISFPNTDDTFVYTPDSFAVLRQPRKNGFQARAFLQDVISDKATLIEFSNVKHSIPPRKDIDVDTLETQHLKESYQKFQSCSESGAQGCQLLLAVSGLAPSPGSDACFDQIENLLTYAVTERQPLQEKDRAAMLACLHQSPLTKKNVESTLIELLLQIADHPFAAACR